MHSDEATSAVNANSARARSMNPQHVIREIAFTIPITFVVAALVTYLYSLIAHGAGVVDWETAFQLGLVLGIVLPLTRRRSNAR